MCAYVRDRDAENDLYAYATPEVIRCVFVLGLALGAGTNAQACMRVCKGLSAHVHNCPFIHDCACWVHVSFITMETREIL